MAKRGLREMKITQKKHKTKKRREMRRDGVKEVEGIEDRQTDNEKGICFHSRNAGS